ncbi:unknown [Firmicutes bacterium CAG:449]|nr:unknown [Firmicutes bacterium CAG:449]
MPPATLPKPYAKPVAAPISDALPIFHQFHVLKFQFHVLKSQNLPPSDACFTTSIPKPKAKPTLVAISNVNPIPKCPEGSYLLTGSLPQ